MTNEERAQVRNETIDELCAWLQSCISQVDPESEVHKACSAMVGAMLNKKTPEETQDTTYPEEKHYPLSHKH